jgi:hypothetical protein
MKRYSTFVIICLIGLLFLSSFSIAGNSKKQVASQSFVQPGPPPGPPPAPAIPSLQGTTWKGDVTLVNMLGSSTTISGVIVAVTTQADTIISGTITGAITAGDTLNFSGVINQCGPPNIQITAINTLIRAEVMNPPPQSTATTTTVTTSTAAVMYITGSDLATGNSFWGKLTQQ